MAFGGLASLLAEKIISPGIVDEEKSGKVGFAFAYPVLREVEDIHDVHADRVHKGELVVGEKTFGCDMTVLVAFDSIMPDFCEAFLVVVVHWWKAEDGMVIKGKRNES